MAMPNKEKLVGFENPVELPQDEAERARWQEANANWWEKHPMRYDFSDPVTKPEFTREFYEEIDRRFFSAAAEFMPYKALPFETILPFAQLPALDVLEIGVGNGSHAQLIASHAKSFTGIDLTEYAISSTRARMDLFALQANILRMDAEHMQFADASFDFVWSWGVIHHSADTGQVLREIHRVLRPGGKATLMVYHRSFWFYYIMAGFFHGILRGQLLKHRSLHALSQNIIDGALARYYTVAEWRALVSNLFNVEDIFVCGAKAEIVPLPAGRVKTAIMKAIPNGVSRFFTNRLRMGYFLVCELSKPS